MKRLANDFQSWLYDLWKQLWNCLTCDQKIVIQSKPYIIQYIFEK